MVLIVLVGDKERLLLPSADLLLLLDKPSFALALEVEGNFFRWLAQISREYGAFLRFRSDEIFGVMLLAFEANFVCLKPNSFDRTSSQFPVLAFRATFYIVWFILKAIGRRSVLEFSGFLMRKKVTYV